MLPERKTGGQLAEDRANRARGVPPGDLAAIRFELLGSRADEAGSDDHAVGAVLGELAAGLAL